LLVAKSQQNKANKSVGMALCKVVCSETTEKPLYRYLLVLWEGMKQGEIREMYRGSESNRHSVATTRFWVLCFMQKHCVRWQSMTIKTN